MSLGISHSSENNNFSFIKSIYLPFGAKNKKTTMSTKPKSINFVAIILVQTIFFFRVHYPAMNFSQVETLFPHDDISSFTRSSGTAKLFR